MNKFYDNDYIFDVPMGSNATLIKVIDIDTFTAASWYPTSHPKVSCLNFASHRRPGGGYLSVKDIPMPIKTQEEDLFRRSDLPETMDVPEVKRHYPLDNVQGFFTDNIRVTKDKLLHLVTPFMTTMITVPAVVNPNTPEKHQMVRDRARRVLQIAADNKVTVLILGAWGCGVFNNDPETIAHLFKTLILGEFSGVFEEAIFAIPGKDSHNYKVFAEILI